MTKIGDLMGKRWKKWLANSVVFLLIALIWLASVYLARVAFAGLPDVEKGWDLGAILFSAAQVSLFVISILIGFLTIFGWGAVEKKIREVVEEVTKQRLANVEKEARGRSFAIQGYIIGESSIGKDFQDPIDIERLREAISYCEQAYNFLKGTGLSVEFLALNNYLTYSNILRHKARRGYLLECARKLRTAAEEHGSSNLLLTYCRTVLVFSLEPKEISEACALLRDVSSDPDLTPKQKREASLLASLCDEHGVAAK